jgi:hypothetical protein
MTADEAYGRWGFENAPLRFAGIDTLVVSILQGIDEGTLSVASAKSLSDEFTRGCTALDLHHQREQFQIFAAMAANHVPEHARLLKTIGDNL